jgi:hypothetical protein
VALVVALALAALGGVGLPQWVGRVIAGETVVSLTMLGLGIALAMVRYPTATDTIGRQQLKWLAGGACAEQTMQPTQVSLWLRVSLPPRPGTGG